MEYKFKTLECTSDVEKWLGEHPHIRIVSHSSFFDSRRNQRMIDIIYTEPEPDYYRDQGE